MFLSYRMRRAGCAIVGWDGSAAFALEIVG